MAKKSAAEKVERMYIIPLRREFLKVANWRRTEKAVTAAKEFLVRHMKSENVKLSPALNEFLWKHGIKNPPHKVKVNVTKDEKGAVFAELFGEQKKKTKAEKKSAETKKAEVKSENKKEVEKKA